jgi:hypothetical protein
VHPGFEFDELLEMAQRRGLEELELHLRTVLLQRMAGQSRHVVNTTIQTTRLLIGYFRANQGKTAQQILAEAMDLVPLMGPAERNEDLAGGGGDDGVGRHRRSGGDEPTDGGRKGKGAAVGVATHLAEYEDLRRFIFSRFMATSLFSGSQFRTLSISEALHRAQLGMADLRALYQQARDRHVFRRLLKDRMGTQYMGYGPRELSFGDFAGFVADFFDEAKGRANKEEEARRGAALAVPGSGPPAWYACSRCAMPAAHWSNACVSFAGAETDNMDLDMVNELIGQYPLSPTNRCFESLVSLQDYLARKFRADLKGGPLSAALFSERLSYAAVRGLANIGIGMISLRDFSRVQLLAKMMQAPSYFPRCLNLNPFATIIHDFLALDQMARRGRR